jgi:hypothetical protein
MINGGLFQRDNDDFERKTWMQINKSNSTWVWSRPKAHISMNARPFPVIVHTYLVVRQYCLELNRNPSKEGTTAKRNLALTAKSW